MTPQPGILLGIPNHGRYIELRAKAGASLKAIKALTIDDSLVVGNGPRLANRPDLHGFEALSGRVDIPSTQADLMLWLRGDDAGEIATRARHLLQFLPDFEPVRTVNGFKYGVDLDIGKDLSGYEDGTENPTGDAALKAAFAHSLAPFEALLTRMAGLDDNIPDALFTFTRPLSGATYWCPPIKDGKLSL